MPTVSILIPVQNEADNIAFVLDEIDQSCAELGDYEIIAVDDGSTDSTRRVLLKHAERNPRLRVLHHDRAAGKSAAVQNAALAARAPIACTIDGDGQNPAQELVALCRPLIDDATGRIGLVAGQRVGRKDTSAKRMASRFANGLRSRALRDGTRDTGCGLKAFRREPFLALPFFDNMHRYYPALFGRDGWEVRHVDVVDRPRLSGRSKYTNLERALVGMVDLIGVVWLVRRRKKALAHPSAPKPARADAPQHETEAAH